jgi:hypothetical protein
MRSSRLSWRRMATSASHPEEVAAHLDLAVALKPQLSFLPIYLDRQESAQA